MGHVLGAIGPDPRRGGTTEERQHRPCPSNRTMVEVITARREVILDDLRL